MKAKHTILYLESISDIELGINSQGFPQNLVMVELSKWASKKGVVYILRTHEILEGNHYTQKEILEEGTASCTRQAITTFDSLVKSHPNLGKEN